MLSFVRGAICAPAVMLLGLSLPVYGAEPAPRNDEAFIAEVAQRLFAAAEPVEGYDWPPVVKVAAEAEVNAFASLDRKEIAGTVRLQPQICIKQGFLDVIVQGNEDRLALVMGHELAHILLRHVEVNPAGTPLIALAISREQEADADVLGFKLALKAGFRYDELIECPLRLRENANYNTFEGLNATHPSPTERIRMLETKRPELWRALSAFEAGVQFLLYEQFPLAERCFEQVTRDMPECYEGWANLGYARLMMYCDKMNPGDLKAYDIGHLVVGGFYHEATSVERGIDDKLWFDAFGALRDAVRLKPDAVLPKATMAIAYLVHPAGKDVGGAERLFQEIIPLLQAGKLENLDPLSKAALYVNAGVTEMSAGHPEISEKFFDEAARLLSNNVRGKSGNTAPLLAALSYNRAFAKSASTREEDRRAALIELEKFLKSGSTKGLWWSRAYENYERLCGELQVTAKTKEELARKREDFRVVVEVSFSDGTAVGLTESIADVEAKWGKSVKLPVVRRTNIARLIYADRGVELIATDRVFGICVKGANAQPVAVQASTPGAPRQEIRVGMSFDELKDVLGTPTDVDYRQVTDRDRWYRYYRSLGLAVMVVENKVTEIVIAQLPTER